MQPPAVERSGERFDSWKQIAAHLGRSERTARRWEEREGLPVHRLQHEKRGSIFAYRKELDAWWESRKDLAETPPDNGGAEARPAARPIAQRWQWRAATGIALLTCLGAGCLGFAWWISRPRAGDQIASVAVLPFVTSGAPGVETQWTDGFSGEIANALGRVPGLRVAAQSSSVRFRGSNAGPREIGRSLNVGALLQGSVRAAGDRVRIEVELIHASDGRTLWSAAFDRGSTGLSSLAPEITRAVAGNLGFNGAGAVPPARRGANAEAYPLLLKARYSPASDADQRIGLYRRVLDLDPGSAEAHAGLASEWAARAGQGVVPPRQVMEDARTAIRKALELDHGLEHAHFVSAMILWSYEWDWRGADLAFTRTLQINPNSAATRIQYARYLALMGRRDEALDQLERIHLLDPISSNLGSIAAAVYYLTRDYDRAIQYGQAVLAAEPDHRLMNYWIGRALDSKGRVPEAMAALEKWRGLPDAMQGRGFGMLGSVYARAGRRADALRLLETAIARSRRTYVSACSVALVYIGLGEHDRAIEWLEKAYGERDYSLVALKADPAYDPLRGHAKFKALVRRMNFDAQS